jgi:hypothetical protein
MSTLKRTECVEEDFIVPKITFQNIELFNLSDVPLWRSLFLAILPRFVENIGSHDHSLE